MRSNEYFYIKDDGTNALLAGITSIIKDNKKMLMWRPWHQREWAKRFESKERAQRFIEMYDIKNATIINERGVPA